jgi:hypothetical protein
VQCPVLTNRGGGSVGVGSDPAGRGPKRIELEKLETVLRLYREQSFHFNVRHRRADARQRAVSRTLPRCLVVLRR